MRRSWITAVLAMRAYAPVRPEPSIVRIEPRRCVSYLTIEHKGDISHELASAFGNRVYGCDDCLAACPWNKFATPTSHSDLRPRRISRRLSWRSSRHWTTWRSAPGSVAPRSSGLETTECYGMYRSLLGMHGGILKHTSNPGQDKPWLGDADGALSSTLGGRSSQKFAAAACLMFLFHLAASTRAQRLAMALVRDLRKVSGELRHIRWRIERSSSVPLPSSPSKK